MARYKLDVQKRQHRERSQPLQRQRLGLLEKHSDYVQRAKDYNSKKDRIQKLRLKASLKNHDEFYFKMINSKTINGLHYNFNKSNPPLDNQLVKLLKTQDFNYVKTCRAIEQKKIIKLKEILGSLVTRVESESSTNKQEDLNLEILDLINESILATGAKNLDSTYQADLKSDQEESRKTGKKIVFVDTVEQVKNFDPFSLRKKNKRNHNKPHATTSSSIVNKSQNDQTSAERFCDEGQFTADQEAHMKKLITELKSRLSRLRVLQKAERELELKKSLMGKGSKFLKFGSSGEKPKLKGLINGRDLSWYDKLDRNQLIEEDLEREKAEQLNAGIKTGAKVWKWKQERKK